MLTQKELEAGVMVLSTIVISAWVYWDASSNGVPAELSASAWSRNPAACRCASTCAAPIKNSPHLP